jgi:two-component system phosphate regulon sensor histidine kinase PhoR
MNADTPRILVVDDELGMREGCRRILTAEGYEVETADDGLAGLETFERRGPFAAALVDLKMPRLGGLELIERILAKDREIVLLVITAYATIDTAVEATKRGAYGYIPKPFTPDELLLPVKNGLEKRALSLEAKRLRDEREKRLLEVAFERSKSNTIINCMTDAVLVVNREGQIVLRNAAAGRVIPACAEVALPAALSTLEGAGLRDLIGETLAGAGPHIVSRETTLGGCTFMVNASPVIEPSGETIGAVAVLRDITALKKLETAKSMFVSMVAHEIRNPLAAIEGYLDLILSGLAGEDPARDRQMLERALLRARTLRTLVSELMNLTAIETGHFTIRRSPLDLAGVAVEAVESCRSKADERRIELGFTKPESGSACVLADRSAMLSVFTNLIDNAVKYTPEGGHVDVRVESQGPYVTVAVRDDGIGMSADEKAHACDEFYRAKNAFTARVPGTGLGLSLVKRLVELHDGKLAIQSAPGQGSTFTVSLPALCPAETRV